MSKNYKFSDDTVDLSTEKRNIANPRLSRTIVTEEDGNNVTVDVNEKKKKKKLKKAVSIEPIDRTEELYEIESIFQQFRKLNNEKGGLTVKQLYPTFKILGMQKEIEELNEIVHEKFGKREGEPLRHYEFAKLIVEELLPFQYKYKQIINAFKVFDEDDTGFISTENLRIVMTSIGDQLLDDEVNVFIMESDIDRDGMVNYEIFVKKMFEKLKIDVEDDE